MNDELKQLMEQLGGALEMNQYIGEIYNNDKGDTDARVALSFNASAVQTLTDAIKDNVVLPD